MIGTDVIQDATAELFDDIDFMEQPGECAAGVPWGWVLAGAAMGLGALFLSHPIHGERRRAQMSENCRKFGRDCGTGLLARLDGWRRKVTHAADDFQTEIRNHAPPYLQ